MYIYFFNYIYKIILNNLLLLFMLMNHDFSDLKSYKFIWTNDLEHEIFQQVKKNVLLFLSINL